MKKYIRVLLLLSPLIIAGFGYYELTKPWQPPISPDGPHFTTIGALLDHNETYKAPMKVIFNNDVFNKTGDILFFNAGGRFLKVNCSGVDASAIESGMMLYIIGVSYLHDPTKEYFLAEDIHIHVTYSLYLSIPGAILILLILFVGFRFTLDDFSFSRKKLEEHKDA
ncbi:MAG: hypothetical protein HWN65_20745 [Candidatus Helarchaeota archaeon]|nr:hypothetical protein [Candidatus Helarchaeota archaeon]